MQNSRHCHAPHVGRFVVAQHENGLELVLDGIGVTCLGGSEGEAINEQNGGVTTHNRVGNRQRAEENRLVELGEARPELFVLSVVDERAHEELQHGEDFGRGRMNRHVHDLLNHFMF